MKTKGLAGTAAVILMTTGLLFVNVGAANAATHTGTKLCNVPKSALLTTNATAAGSGQFTNYNNTAQSYPIYFSGGFDQTSSAYTNTIWAASAAGFYSTPTATCY